MLFRTLIRLDIFVDYAKHFEEDGDIHSYVPEFHPYWAQCISVVPDRLTG
jgi:hypothetical protein